MQHAYQNWKPDADTDPAAEGTADVVQQECSVQVNVMVVDRIPFSNGNGPGAPGISFAAGFAPPLENVDLETQVGPQPSSIVPQLNVRLHLSKKDIDRNPKIVLSPASTLFTNGRETTMFAEHWKAQTDANNHLKFQRVSARRHLTRMTFTQRLVKSSMRLSLERLTAPRTISRCMGNVLSKLVNENGLEPTSASQELEEKVAANMKDRGYFNAAPPIFALVIPRSPGKGKDTIPAVVVRNLLGQKRPDGTKALDQRKGDKSDLKLALSKGAHLHRVTSGGGGWGLKQGLLSLDPARTLHDDLGHSQKLKGEESMVSDQGPLSQPVVRPGDRVAFYVSYASRLAKQAKPDKHVHTEGWSADYWSQEINTRMFWGVIPEEDVAANGGLGLPHPRSGVISVPHHFGMLSIKGMAIESWGPGSTLQTPPSSSSSSSSPLSSTSIPKSTSNGHPIHVTRLDAPYTTLWCSSSAVGQ